MRKNTPANNHLLQYLVGLSTLIGGYVWFLYHNREVSYRSAMNFTVSRRQQKLYSQHNFDVRKWEALIEDGNVLRKEIKAVANEYDVEWDEVADETDETAAEALRKERKKKKEKGKDEDEKKADGE
jgi:calcium uniporter protein, mitochondrial